MRKKINENSFKGQAIYVGIDVHKNDWKVSVMSAELLHKTFSCSPDPVKLHGYLSDHFPGASYRAAYEASFCGFWIHRELTKLGVQTIVVNPGDIPTTDKERAQKEDRRDSRKLAKTLRAGQLNGIHVPSSQVQQDRILIRSRDKLVGDLNRNKVRVKHMLHFLGIEAPDLFKRQSSWSGRYISWLESIKMEYPSGQAGMTMYLENIHHQRKQLLKMNRNIRELSRSPYYYENCSLLMTIPGIGRLTAMKLLTELDQLDRFENFSHLCSYVGLIPSTNSSGERIVERGITRRGNQSLRVALIESSWIAVRNDPALLSAYQRLRTFMPGSMAIIRIAKKLLRRIVHTWRKKEAYQKGIVE